MAGTCTAVAVQFSTLSKRLEAVGFSSVFGITTTTTANATATTTATATANANATSATATATATTTGTSEQSAASALEWFASVGLQLGNRAAKAGYCESSTVIHVSVASALSHHPSPSTATCRLRRLAAALAMMSAVTVSLEMPGKKAASLMLAKRMHGLAVELTPACGPGSDPQVRHVQSLLAHLEAKVAIVSGDQAAVLHHVCHVLPALPPQLQPSHEQLLHLASLCSAHPGEDPEARHVVQQLYQLALQQLVRQKPPVDYELIAWLLHAQLELCDTDTARLAAFKEASALITQLAADVREDEAVAGAGGPEGSSIEAGLLLFPQVELEWLVGTCWNRGVQHARFMNASLAVEFMRAALELLRFTPSEYAQPLKPMMEQQLRRLVDAA